MNKESNPKQIKLTVEKIVAGGDGLCRSDNGVIFVERVLPEEDVLVEITSHKKGFSKGKPIEILKPSPFRVDPGCPLFKECGGCAWQHIDYDHQLKLKTEIVQEAFARTGGIKRPAPSISGNKTGYGNRNRFRFQNRQGQYSLFKGKTKELIAVNHCPVAVDGINHYLGENSPESNSGARNITMKEATLFASNEKCYTSETDNEAKVTLLDKEFLFNPGHFFQANITLFEQLIKEFILPESGESAVDLYCGSGIFSAFLADKFKSVTAVESFAPAAPFLKKNCPDNVKGITSPVEDFRWKEEMSPELAVVDPPRTGLGPAAIEVLLQINPKKVIYISCDPVTMARDMKTLVASGYVIETHKLFDFYPQTSHIESVVVMTR